MTNEKKELLPQQRDDLIDTLKNRFEQHMHRHKDIQWADVEAKLIANPTKLWVLDEMEVTGGEPDVVDYNEQTDEYIFFDCAAETPKGRRSLCYDRAAWESRKAHKPRSTAMDMAQEMGITILTETQYRSLQELGKVDTKTSSWLKTPTDIRDLGGAIFGDFRFGRVFIYHNGADSYYSVRGFRGSLAV